MKNETTNNEAKMAIGMNREIQANMKDENTVLTSSKVIRSVFHNHVIDMETGECGIEKLITRIMREHGAESAKTVVNANGETVAIEQSELRQSLIGMAMHTDEIANEVQSRFSAGSIRYPLQTIKSYLSVFMFKQGKVGKVQLTGKEDSNRPCDRPRCKWYLVKA